MQNVKIKIDKKEPEIIKTRTDETGKDKTNYCIKP